MATNKKKKKKGERENVTTTGKESQQYRIFPFLFRLLYHSRLQRRWIWTPVLSLALGTIVLNPKLYYWFDQVDPFNWRPVIYSSDKKIQQTVI